MFQQDILTMRKFLLYSSAALFPSLNTLPKPILVWSSRTPTLRWDFSPFGTTRPIIFGTVPSSTVVHTDLIFMLDSFLNSLVKSCVFFCCYCYCCSSSCFSCPVSSITIITMFCCIHLSFYHHFSILYSNFCLSCWR